MERPNCTACELATGRNYIVWGEGPDKPLILGVGEGPGESEDLTGRPFVGMSGKMLRRGLQEAGFGEKEVYLTNLVRCRPPKNRDPKPTEIQTCTRLHLVRDMERLEPTLILAIGRIATKYLTGRDLKDCVNQVIPSTRQFGSRPVLCWYHPAAIGRSRKRLAGIWHQGIAALKAYFSEKVVVSVDSEGLAMDTETAWPLSDDLITISASWKDKDDVYENERLKVGLALAGDAARPIFHNAAFDLRKLERDPDRPFEDTMLMAYVLGEPQVGLKPLSLVHLGRKLDTVDYFVQEYGNMSAMPQDKRMKYAMADSRATLDLFHVLSSRLTPDIRSLYELELEVCPILMRATDIGLPVDVIRLDSLLADAITLMKEEETVLGINPGSLLQLQDLLYKKHGFPVIAKTKEAHTPATDKDTLRQLQAQLPSSASQALLGSVLRWKAAEANKRLLVQYKGLLGADGRLHPEFRQARVASGRLSSSGPNVQNTPKPLRKIVVAPEGYLFLHGDFAQLELRTMAAIANEQVLIDVFKGNGDPHQALATQIGQTRDIAKMLNYAIGYGAEATRIAFAGNMSIDEAQSLLERARRAYPNIERLRKEIGRQLQENEEVSTLFGRPRKFPGYNSYPQTEKSAALREAFNHAAGQGTAADIVKMLMVETRRKGLSSLWNQVHDSLEFVEPSGGIENAKEVLESAVRAMQILPNGVELVMEVSISKEWM